MTDEKLKQLVQLLKELRASDLLAPNMPKDLWLALQAVTPQPAVEVLMTRTGKDFYLVNRKDEWWDGWHIPGGFMSCNETIPDALNRVAKREVGISVEFQRLLTARTWQDHPYANPMSIVCVCKPLGEPTGGEWFTEIPDKMVPVHPIFLKLLLETPTQ